MCRSRGLVLALLLLAEPALATTYYVDCGAGAGGDGSVGTPWNTMEAAWAASKTWGAGSHTVNVAATACTIAARTAGGARAGVDVTWQAASGAQVTLLGSNWCLDVDAGGTGTNTFQGADGTHRWTWLYPAGTTVFGPIEFDAAGTVTFRYCDLDGSAPTSSAYVYKMDVNGATLTLDRCKGTKIRPLLSGTGVGTVNATANYFVNLNATGFSSATAGMTFNLYNNTFYGTTTRPKILTGSAETTYNVKNNLIVTDAALATSWAVAQFDAAPTLTSEANVAWNTNGISNPPNENDFPWTYSTVASTYYPNIVAYYNPDLGTLPAINSTSMLVGRGEDAGVAYDYYGTAYAVPTIGCMFPTGASKTAYAATNNEIAAVGDSTGAEEQSTTTQWTGKLKALLGGSYTWTNLPGAAPAKFPCTVGWKLYQGIHGLATYLAVSAHPEFVLFGTGLNDVAGGWDGAEVASQVRAIVADLKRIGVTKQIFVGAMAQDGYEDDGDCAAISGVNHTEADATETALAAYCGTDFKCAHIVTDFESVDANWCSYYSVGGGGIHPNDAGYARMAALLNPLVNSYESNGGGRDRTPGGPLHHGLPSVIHLWEPKPIDLR